MTNSIFVEGTGALPERDEPWEPVVIPKEDIDAEIARLAALPRPANGRRRSYFVHPRNKKSRGLAPGIEVALDVLLPGEETITFRQNSTQVNFVIRGEGETEISGRLRSTKLHDVWNTPSMRVYRHRNTGDDIYVRLTYSNGALLDMMNIHIVEENPAPAPRASHDESEGEVEDARKKSPYGTFPLNDEGAWMMPYELLINPPSVQSPALYWPWDEVKEHLDKLEALGKDYIGRRLYLLYNPMTGRTNGTTPNFFATMTVRPPKIVDRPHRHSSAAVNYYFSGSGRSTVEGKTYEWKSGDLMLSAPGWAVHNHASFDEPVYELTIQDQPLNIAMESLLWQESLKEPPALLGAEEGFATNRADAAA
ncbi:cupin domain-containing protein [Novosphingobium sp. RL4]|uniref:cupin domain-containing protein n=1 Tax=Novosphingobium sp. RL4 TaxID=3109595 RepID=UPI002D7A14BA|nr:AraC family ligand binding domain-containing protein [Novosphingobium sp. RL4]WRT94447.1 AraC family ligand binding domain-containing protein [Novosphingobium sp. RL4]